MITAHLPETERLILALIGHAGIDAKRRRDIYSSVDSSLILDRVIQSGTHMIRPVGPHVRMYRKQQEYVAHARAPMTIDAYLRLASTSQADRTYWIEHLQSMLAVQESDAAALVRLLADAHIARSALDSMTELQRLLTAQEGIPDVNAAIREIGQRLIRSSAESSSLLLMRHHSLLEQHRADTLEAWSIARTPASGGQIPTGWQTFDDGLGGGLQRQEFMLLGAPTNSGKSTAAISVAVHAFLAGNNVMYIPLEMPPDGVEKRIQSSLSVVGNSHVGSISYSELERGASPERLAAAWENIKINYRTAQRATLTVSRRRPGSSGRRLSIDELAATVSCADPRPDLVIVDYIGILETPEGMDRRNEETVLRYTAQQLGALAIDLNCAIIGLAQANKDGDDFLYCKGLRNAPQYSVLWAPADEYGYITMTIPKWKRWLPGGIPPSFDVKPDWDYYRWPEVKRENTPVKPAGDYAY